MKSSESKPFIRTLRNLLPLILLSTLGSQNTPTTTHGSLSRPTSWSHICQDSVSKVLPWRSQLLQQFPRPWDPLVSSKPHDSLPTTWTNQSPLPSLLFVARAEDQRLRSFQKFNPHEKLLEFLYFCAQKMKKLREWWLVGAALDGIGDIHSTAAASTFTPNWYSLFRGRLRIWSWWGLS